MLLVISFSINGCHTVQGRPEGESALTAQIPITQYPPVAPSTLPEPSFLDLTFAGDIMAHTVNFSMADYSKIYEDLKPLLSSDDLTFGNFETPVADALPLSTYPRFNVHSPYMTAAVSGGFDVFALANNHSNDQGIKGIAGTLAAFGSHPQPVYYSGLRKTAADPLVPVIVKKKGWTVLFLSVTEILNSYDGAGKLVYYVAPTETARTAFLSEIGRIRAENPADMLILSIHLNESEYVRTVSEAKKKWFLRLASSGADIVWGHHPHVMQSWETVALGGESSPRPVLFMYSMGNFISGQRFSPEKANPGGMREYTGDAALLKVRISRTTDSGYSGISAVPLLVTNYTDPEHGVVVRVFDTPFTSTLSDSWKVYYRKRLEYMHAYLPLLPLAPVTGILTP